MDAMQCLTGFGRMVHSPCGSAGSVHTPVHGPCGSTWLHEALQPVEMHLLPLAALHGIRVMQAACLHGSMHSG